VQKTAFGFGEKVSLNSTWASPVACLSILPFEIGIYYIEVLPGEAFLVRPDGGEDLALRFKLFEKFDFAIAQGDKFAENLVGPERAEVIQHGRAECEVLGLFSFFFD
jgi:hypothetical protein